MIRALVTGAAGFVGQRVTEALRNVPSVTVTPLRRGAQPSFTPALVQIDLARADHLDALERSGLRFDVVVHLAGRVDVSLRPAARATDPPVPGSLDFGDVYRENTLATAHLASYALRTSVRHVIFASTQAVYGLPTEQPLTETSPCRPLEHYAASKLCAEALLEVAAKQGLSVTVLRFGGIFAPERTGGVVRRLVEAGIRDQRMVIAPEHPVPLDVLHRDDLTDAIVRATIRPASGMRRLNVSTGEPCSLNLLAESIAALIPGCAVQHAGVAQPVVQLDNARARADLDWRPRPLSACLAEVVRAAQQAMVH